MQIHYQIPFFPKFHYVFLKFIIIHQQRHIFSFINVSCYMLSFLVEIYIKVQFFNIFVAKKKLKSLFTKRDLSRYYYFIIFYIFIEIGLLCWWNFCFLISISPKFYNYFFHFYICFQKFLYGFSLFIFFPCFDEIKISSKLIASILLLIKIRW